MSTTSMAIFSNPLFATYSIYARNASIISMSYCTDCRPDVSLIPTNNVKAVKVDTMQPQLDLNIYIVHSRQTIQTADKCYLMFLKSGSDD